MNTPLPGHASPRASFDAPLAMLAQCHDRAGAQVSTLRRLLEHLPRHGADAQARDAAKAVMRYFDIAARDHHADEEKDLFPALLEAMAGSDAVCLRELTESLRGEHRQLEALWHTLRPQLAAIAAGEAAALDGRAAEALIHGYERHIVREDGELLPLAARLLDDNALARMAWRCANGETSTRGDPAQAGSPRPQGLRRPLRCSVGDGAAPKALLCSTTPFEEQA